MKYLVIGGTGFIGSHVVKQLIGKGRDVVTYDASIDENAVRYVLDEQALQKITMVKGDITDLARLIETIKKHDIDTIIHLAFLMTVEDPNPTLELRVGCEGTINVYEAARTFGIKKIAYASSNSVFGRASQYPYEYLPDDAPQGPHLSMYGACKSMNEYLAGHYFERYGLDSVGIRFPMVYGPGRMRGGGMWTAELINKPAAGLPGRVRYGDETINFLYAEDAARSLVMASEAGVTKKRAYNISGFMYNVERVYHDFVKKFLPDANVTFIEPRRWFIAIPWKMDATGLKQDVGFEPKYTVEQGVRATINFVRSNRNLPPV